MDAVQQNPAATWVQIHPLVVRVTHWINVLAILIMVTSGWQIYNAAPLFGFTIPGELTLGGWLGGALQWHFAAMWLLALCGGYEGARLVHFFAMAVLVLIVLVHIGMVILVPRTFLTMFSGRTRRLS